MSTGKPNQFIIDAADNGYTIKVSYPSDPPKNLVAKSDKELVRVIKLQLNPKQKESS